jgi:multiple sugar transport system permease protein
MRHRNGINYLKPRESLVPYILISSSLAFFIVFWVVPLVSVIFLGFRKTDYFTSEWIGLQNYIEMFKDPYYYKALTNSLFYASIIIIGQLGISLFVSLMVFNMPLWTHSTVRFVFYIPVFASGIIISNAWKWIFHPRGGLLNWFIGLFGAEPIIWFGNRITAIVAIGSIQTISYLGFYVLVLLAAMMSVDRAQFDSARIDGASWFRIKLSIILPQILPQIFFITLLAMISAFQIFEYIFMLSGGGPDYGSASLMYDIYNTGIGLGKYGMASARSIMLMSILLILAIVKYQLEKRKKV